MRPRVPRRAESPAKRRDDDTRRPTPDDGTCAGSRDERGTASSPRSRTSAGGPAKPPVPTNRAPTFATLASGAPLFRESASASKPTATCRDQPRRSEYCDVLGLRCGRGTSPKPGRLMASPGRSSVPGSRHVAHQLPRHRRRGASRCRMSGASSASPPADAWPQSTRRLAEHRRVEWPNRWRLRARISRQARAAEVSAKRSTYAAAGQSRTARSTEAAPRPERT